MQLTIFVFNKTDRIYGWINALFMPDVELRIEKIVKICQAS